MTIKIKLIPLIVPLRANKYKWNHDNCFCSQCCPGKWRNEND